VPTLNNWRQLSKLVVALLLTLTATGCCWMTGSDVTDVCRVFEPIRWSVHDTPETIRQIKVYNARLQGLCGRDPSVDD